jgi:hypothetical protein
MSLERQIDSIGMSDRKSVAVTARRYLAAILGGTVTALAAFCALYGALYMTGYLPPPPLSNNVCADEKLVFLRHNLPGDPNFLVVGSSVAWRNIDSDVIAREVSGARPLNGGFCGMQVHQSAFITDWMIDHWPSVQQVLLVVSPLDYGNCRGTGQVFDPIDANKFVFEGDAIWGFYLRYFDPVSLNRNIRRQAQDRKEARRLKIVRGFTKYGDGPLDTNENRGLFYGPMSQTDAACFAALRSLATDLADQGRKFMVVATPMHPDWKATYDADGAFRARFSHDMEAALEGTGAQIWNADDAEMLDATAFTDAIHVRWSSAGRLTHEILRKLRLN